MLMWLSFCLRPIFLYVSWFFMKIQKKGKNQMIIQNTKKVLTRRKKDNRLHKDAKRHNTKMSETVLFKNMFAKKKKVSLQEVGPKEFLSDVIFKSEWKLNVNISPNLRWEHHKTWCCYDQIMSAMASIKLLQSCIWPCHHTFGVLKMEEFAKIIAMHFKTFSQKKAFEMYLYL